MARKKLPKNKFNQTKSRPKLKKSGRFGVKSGFPGVHIYLKYWTKLDSGAPTISAELVSTEIECWLKDTIEDLELVAKEAMIVARRVEAEPLFLNTVQPKKDND